MFNPPVIQLLKGFCDITFGENFDNIKKVFGEPEELQTLKDDILNTSCLVYHYWEKGFSLFFDNTKNNTFSSVEIDNKETILFNVKLFALKEKELIDLMKANGFAKTDTETHEWGEKRVSFDSAGLDCYFQNNKLVSVNFGLIDTENKFNFFPN